MMYKTASRNLQRSGFNPCFFAQQGDAIRKPERHHRVICAQQARYNPVIEDAAPLYVDGYDPTPMGFWEERAQPLYWRKR